MEAQTVTATNGAQISSATFGTGQGGSVTVMARDSVTFRGTSPPGEALMGVLFPGESTFASGALAASLSSGAPGRVQVTAPRVTLAEGGGISGLNVASPGVGGTVTVHAPDTLAISGGGSGLSTASLGPGAGGDIIIHAGTLSLTEGANISAASLRTDDATASGNAGNIVIRADQLFRSRNGAVTTEAARAGGGRIALQAGRLVQLQDSEVTTSVRGGGGDAGNLTLTAPFVVADDSRIVANAFGGMGGNILIDARVFLRDPASLVSASSALGIQGTVDIRAPVTTLSGTLAPLPQAFVNVVALLPARCAARLSGGKYSSLVLGGRDALPADPSGVLPSPLALEERLVADPVVIGAPHEQTSAAKFALLTGQEKTLPRIGCPK